MSPPALLAALRVEQAALAGSGARHTGMGPVRSRRALLPREDLAAGALLAGVAGGLAPGVRPGDVVVASEVRGPAGVVTVASAPLLAAALRRAGLRVHLGPVVSSDRLVTGRHRRRLAEQGALAVDQESATAAQLVGAAGGPFAVVRVVVDTADHPLVHPGTATRGVQALSTLRRCAPVLAAWRAAAGAREVVLAEPRSFCAGVERAIDIVERALTRYGAPVHVRRQIVHNAHVVRGLEARGAVFVDEVDQVPFGGRLVLAAHGVAPAVRSQAAERDLLVVDATCPLVAKVHTEVRRHAERGDTIVLIGHRDHEEVEGTVGEAPGQVVVVADAAEAATVQVSERGRLAYAMQTTLAVDEAEQVAAVLRGRFPAISAPATDDICYATSNRQAAVRAVAAECDLLLVLGSANSSNSRRLVEVAERAGVAARLVEDVGQVELDWLVGVRRVGVSAGASAPPHLVDELLACLAGLGPTQTHSVRVATEDIRFSTPKEVS